MRRNTAADFRPEEQSVGSPNPIEYHIVYPIEKDSTSLLLWFGILQDNQPDDVLYANI